MELLIHNTGRGAEGDKDWNRGDIVTVKYDGWEWGRQENPATRTDDPVDLFVILKVPGEALGIEVRRNFCSHIEDENGLVYRGYFRVDLDNLPPAVAIQVAMFGIGTIGWGVLKANLIAIEPGTVTDPEDQNPDLV
jgi:hypothetical protein